jgi:D-galactarolactone cycloisomerase
MKISGITTFELRAPTASAFYSSQGLFTGRKSLLVRVETDDGLVGWGEGGQYGPAQPVRACIDEVLAPALLGAELTAPQLLWEASYARLRDFGMRGPTMEAMSALDIAFWDIVGKHFSVPVSQLIGGRHRESVRAYGTGFYYPQDEPLRVDAGRLRAECDEKAGFAAVKAKIGLLPLRDDIERLQVIREHMGPGVDLMVDSNHAYNLPTARRAAAALGDLDVLWFEEPLVPEDKESYRRLRDTSPVAIAAGECEYNRFGFHELISGGCVDIAQPDLAVAGGISEWTRIHTLATAVGVSVIPHVWGSGISLAAALHVLAATPLNPHTTSPVPIQNEPVLEFDTSDNPLRSEVITTPFTLVDGRVAVPGGPGLGITVDEDAVRRYAER